MAFRKGKAQRRVKDLAGLERSDEADDVFDRESLQLQRVKLPSDRDTRVPTEEELADRPRGEGMVTALFPGGAYVRIGPSDLLCSLAGTFRPPKNTSALAVGDEVTVAMVGEAANMGKDDMDKQRSDGIILFRQTRRTMLSRPQPTSGKRREKYEEEVFEKVVAANMDILAVVASVKSPRIRLALIDRFCIVAERGDMKPIVVINKIDLAKPDKAMLGELTEGGVQVLQVSAKRNIGLDELRAAMAGKRTVLAGASGVGKSSLVNALVPGAVQATGEIRQKDQRGRHVTAATTMHELPGGGLLIDTPGVRELALEMDVAELTYYFPDIAAVAPQCHFNDCSHTHEPECAVQAAVEEGKISPRRYASYLRILDTL